MLLGYKMVSRKTKKLSSSVCDLQGFPVIIPDSETSRILGMEVQAQT